MTKTFKVYITLKANYNQSERDAESTIKQALDYFFEETGRPVIMTCKKVQVVKVEVDTE